MSTVTVARALTARVGRRAIRFFTMLVVGSISLLIVMTIVLVYVFSPWWWLLLLPIGLITGVFVIIRLIVSFIVGKIHTEHMNDRQREALDAFVDKIQDLLEARATPPWIFVFITIKDILLYRDAVTVKKIISDTTGLRRDYDELGGLF